MLYAKELIHGKPIYTVSSHNFAFAAWADIQRTLCVAPLLLTLDYHTDTHPAFLRLASSHCNGTDFDAWRSFAKKYLEEVKLDEPRSIENAALSLRNDEHINAAVETGILSGGFIIQYHDFNGTTSREEQKYFSSDGGLGWLFERKYPERPYTYLKPENGIFVVGADCSVGCTRHPHTEECTEGHANQAIESAYLDSKLAIIAEMSPSLNVADLLAQPYILDIDLDYFRTEKSINPADATTFYRLIEQSLAITIATEPTYVESCRLEGEKITSNSLLTTLMYHIHQAMGK